MSNQKLYPGAPGKDINKAVRCQPVDRVPLIWQGNGPRPGKWASPW
jgi:hypothetical protein